MTFNARGVSCESYSVVRLDKVAVIVDLRALWCGPMVEVCAGATEVVEAGA